MKLLARFMTNFLLALLIVFGCCVALLMLLSMILAMSKYPRFWVLLALPTSIAIGLTLRDYRK